MRFKKCFFVKFLCCLFLVFGAPEIKKKYQVRNNYALSTQYRVFLYFFFPRAQSAQQVRKMGFSGAPVLFFDAKSESKVAMALYEVVRQYPLKI